eukprot:gene31198-39164_t
MKVPVYKHTLCAFANELIAGTEVADKFTHGIVDNNWYYGFLARYEMRTVANPDWVHDDPDSCMIHITKPDRLFSFDETRLTMDCTDSSKSRQHRIVKTGKADNGEVLVNKGGGVATGVGGSFANGASLPPFFIFGGADSEVGILILLRPPHTSSISQGEDVINFAVFKPEFRTAKALLLVNKLDHTRSPYLTMADLM